MLTDDYDNYDNLSDPKCIVLDQLDNRQIIDNPDPEAEDVWRDNEGQMTQ